MATNVTLPINRSFLDPMFDGYKLSLDKLPTYRVEVEQGVDEAKLTNDQYSLQHLKAFGVHNHLQSDPWNPDSVFLVDSQWNIRSFTVSPEGRPATLYSVLKLPEAPDARLTPGRHNVTLSFPCADWAVVANGAGVLHIVETKDRLRDTQWQVVHSEEVLGEGVCFAVKSTTFHTDSEGHHLDCLLLHVAEVESPGNEGRGQDQSAFVTRLEWINFKSANGTDWKVMRTRELETSSCPEYVSLDATANSILVAGLKPTRFTYDSLKPVQEPKVVDQLESKPHPGYTWMQDDDEVSVTFSIPSNVSKTDVLFKLTGDHVELGVKDGPTLLKGLLFEKVNVDESTWTIQDNKLELVLFKLETSSWPNVVPGDTRGEMVVDEARAAEIHERLAHLTSESWNPDPNKAGLPAFNQQQLEECDIFPNDAAVMQRFHGDTHLCTHQVNLSGNQLLFSQRITPGQPPAVCFQHDVDGLVWQPVDVGDTNNIPWEHIGTFNALGFVRNSKQQMKFAGCAPDLSYAVIVDCVRHTYLYRQPSPTLTPIRNRRTGQQVGAVAKQHVISLDSTSDTLGFHITNDQLFYLAGRTLYVVKVNQCEEV